MQGTHHLQAPPSPEGQSKFKASLTAPLEWSGGLAGAEEPGPLRGLTVPCRHMLHKQKGYKVTSKKVHSVPGAQARQGRASGQSAQLLTLGAPGNFFFVGGVG